MEKVKNHDYGVTSITVTLEIADSIEISRVLKHLDRYDELCKDGVVDKIDSNGNIITTDPIMIAKSEGWDPFEEMMKLRKLCNKFCFVKVAQSNVFDDEEDENHKLKARK